MTRTYEMNLKNDFEVAVDYLKFGDKGYAVENPTNGRTVERFYDRVDTLPTLNCFEDGKYVGNKEFWDAMDWLMELR